MPDRALTGSEFRPGRRGSARPPRPLPIRLYLGQGRIARTQCPYRVLLPQSGARPFRLRNRRPERMRGWRRLIETVPSNPILSTYSCVFTSSYEFRQGGGSGPPWGVGGSHLAMDNAELNNICRRFFLVRGCA